MVSLARSRMPGARFVVGDALALPFADGEFEQVYKRFFTGDGLAEELGGGEVLMDGAWFVVVRS